MNERIEELMAKSFTDEQGEIFDHERFAELIIRECALVTLKATGPRSALNILEHFGVKE